MAQNLPKITLLFCGGATLKTENGKLLSIQTARDITTWLDEVPELSLIADVAGEFIFEDGSEIGPQEWNTIAKTIHEKYQQSDGFVVLHSVDSMLYTSSALSFILPGLTKPVVFTGSPLTPDFSDERKLEDFMHNYRTLGIRANLINAVQVATMNVPEISILMGNQLLRANHARKTLSRTFNIFEADVDGILGRVDFGIKLEHEEEKRKKGKPKFESVKDMYISVVRMHPGYAPKEFATLIKEKPDAILIRTHLQNGIPKSLEPYFVIADKDQIPIIILNPFVKVDVPKGAVSIVGISYEALYTKLLWAASRTSTRKDIYKLLEKNLTGEMHNERGNAV